LIWLAKAISSKAAGVIVSQFLDFEVSRQAEGGRIRR